MTNNKITMGQVLTIQSKDLAVAETPTSAAMQDSKDSELSDHKVLGGESLYSISKKYNVSVQNIREWNNLSSDDLRIGQKLIISK